MPSLVIFEYRVTLSTNAPIKWLAPGADKINQILRYDWLPERVRWSYLARSGLPAVSCKKSFPESHGHILNPLFTKFCSFKMAGDWPRSKKIDQYCRIKLCACGLQDLRSAVLSKRLERLLIYGLRSTVCSL